MKKLAVVAVLALFVWLGLHYRTVQPWTAFPTGKLPLATLGSLVDLRGQDVRQLRQQRYDAEPAWQHLTGPRKVAELPGCEPLGDKPRWVGLDGLLYSDKDTFREHATDGPAVLSSVLLNPYLPILLQYARLELDFPRAGAALWSNPQSDLLPTGAELDGPTRTLTVRYQLKRPTPLIIMAERYGPPHLYLHNLNARDLGFASWAVRPEGTEGFVYWKSARENHPFGEVLPADQQLTKDGETMVRRNSFVTLTLTRLPARLTLDLWRAAQAEAKGTKPDLTEVILLESDRGLQTP